MSLTSLAYYGGYITMDKYDGKDNSIILKIPNTSVRKYLDADYMTSIFRNLKVVEHELKTKIIYEILINTPLTQFTKDKIKLLENHFDSLISPYSYETMNNEKLFQIFLVGIFLQTFENVTLEEKTVDGRIDILIKHRERLFVIECKYGKTSIEALNQIKGKKYYKKFEQNNLPIVLLGINLNRDKITNNKTVEVLYEYIDTTTATMDKE